MFKSIFAKYVTALMVIVTLCFAILLLIVTSIVGNHSADTKKKLMSNAAEVTSLLLEEESAKEAPEAFAVLVERFGKDRLDDLLSAFLEYDSDLTLFIADSQGSVLYVLQGENDAEQPSQLPLSVVASLSEAPTFDTVSVDSSEGELLICANGIFNESGALCGVAAVCSSEPYGGYAVADLTKTVLSSALLVLIAALIAAYFITERTIAPLREMSMAARNFAAGKFDRRVNVRGKDEVAELSEAFNQMADSLENLEKMRNSFVANVSHDLRTPMTTIAGFIDGIRDGVIPPEEHDHYLEVVSIEVQRLSRLVASLLDLSRLQAGDRKFVMKSFDICEMARLILISFEQQIEEKRLEVEFFCEEDRMTVLADHDAVYQIFYNICHNALKFSRPNGMLRICLVYTKEKKVEIAVYNEGEGIPTEDQPYVFERFYKSDKSRGLDKSGVGLGLYIAKTIIAAHGEKIWVASEPGKNCEFFFTLPRAVSGHWGIGEEKNQPNPSL